MADAESASLAVGSVATAVAIVVPLTTLLYKLGNIAIEWLKNQHEISTARIEQSHRITTQYLDRALDPMVPLAIRHQLLRFLAVEDKEGNRLSIWAQQELAGITRVIDETDQAVKRAEKRRLAAKTAEEVAAAEGELTKAIGDRNRVMAEPVLPPITAASLRAGLIDSKTLDGIDLTGENLSGMRCSYKSFKGANFTSTDLKEASLQGCDLRRSTFEGARLERVNFFEADLRGAVFGKTKLIKCDFQRAKLEGADLSEVEVHSCKFPATYDKHTKWPANFDPDANGAVKVSDDEEAGSATKKE